MGLPALRRRDGGSPALLDSAGAADLARQLDLLLSSGRPAPTRGPLGFGSGLDLEALDATPATDAEIWFSSTSTVGPGRHARAAALDALAALAGASGEPLPLSLWFNSLRARLADAIGVPRTGVLFAPSMSEGRALARFVAASVLGAPPTGIYAETEENDDPPDARKNQIVVALRDRDGAPRDGLDIDAEALALARAPLAAGAPLLVHALAMSRTGLEGVSRAAASALRRAAPYHVLALLDAGDFRVAPEAIAAAVADGMMALVSGSRFVGGPAHCVALLLPRELAEALEAAPPRPESDIAPSRLDVPAGLRNAFAAGFVANANIGLGLRWSGALAQFESYLAIPAETRSRVLNDFSSRSRAMAARLEFIELESRAEGGGDGARDSVLGLFPLDPRGGRCGRVGAAAIRAGLALPRPGVAGDAVCHIGAAVATANGAALPLSISAPAICDVAGRLARGVAFERAIAPVWRDLGTLFSKWEALAG